MFFKKTVFFKKSQPVLFLKYPCEIESFVYKQVYYEASLSRRLRSSCAYYTNYILPFNIHDNVYFAIFTGGQLSRLI